MAVEMFFGHRIPKVRQSDIGWERVELNDIDTKRPVLLCFGGNNTIKDRYANFMAKTAERLLNLTPEDKYIDIYSISYKHNEDEDIANMSEEEIKRINESLFLPLLIKDGKRIPTEQAQKNIRNINLFSFSYGSKVVYNLIQNLSTTMGKLGYSDNETSQILSQIFHIAYAPKNVSKLPTTFALKTFADNFFGRFYEAEYRKLTRKTKDETCNLKCGELVINGNTLNLYAEKINDRKFFTEKNDNPFEDEYRNMDDEILPDHDIRSFLLEPDWSQANYRAEIFARCGAYALGFAVHNSKQNFKQKTFEPLPSPSFMKEVIEDMELRGDNENYRERKNEQADDLSRFY